MARGKKHRKQTSNIDPEDHKGLVFLLAKEAGQRYKRDYEELIGPTYLALLDAIRTYNGSTKFSTHAYRTIRWKLYTENMTLAGLKRIRKDGKEEWSKPPLHNLTEYVATVDHPSLEFPQWFQDLSERDKEIVSLRARGMTYDVIAQSVGLSKERVRQILVALATLLHPASTTQQSVSVQTPSRSNPSF